MGKLLGKNLNCLAMACKRLAMILFLGAVLWASSQQATQAAGPVETSVFAVQGVAVDVTDTDASTAKQKALVQVQIKGFAALAEKLGNPDLVATVTAMPEAEVLPFLRSLSVEEEAISPGRYQGKFTVRFLPEKTRAFYRSNGVQVSAEQGPSFLVLPVWNGPSGPVLWEDNPWRQAWISLRAEQSLIPVIVPLGDLDDTELISATDVMNGDPLKLEAIKRRYDVKSVVVAFAEPAEGGGIHARMLGDSPLGKLAFDKIYTAESGTVEDATQQAALRFHTVMIEKFKSGVAKAAEAQQQADASKVHSITVSVPFSGPSQWNGLRSRILETPGVAGVDVSSLGIDGAVVSLTYGGSIEDLGSYLQRSGLNLSRSGENWVIAAN